MVRGERSIAASRVSVPPARRAPLGFVLNVMRQELRIETLFPADVDTATVLRQNFATTKQTICACHLSERSSRPWHSGSGP